MTASKISMTGVLLLLLSFFTSSCAQRPQAAPAPEVPVTVPQVLASFAHDAQAFTQGLLLYQGTFYESTGLEGKSSLREVEVKTGKVLRQKNIPAPIFAEGLARDKNRLVQLTWRDNKAFVYDLSTFKRVQTFTYQGEGWGLCHNGKAFVMSNGSDLLTVRDLKTFDVLRKLPVRYLGKPVTMLNELECVGKDVYANVWQTNYIVKIAPSGQVSKIIDAKNLLAPEVKATLTPDAVLNGIAYDPTEKVFYLTGKLWPKVFKVTF